MSKIRFLLCGSFLMIVFTLTCCQENEQTIQEVEGYGCQLVSKNTQSTLSRFYQNGDLSYSEDSYIERTYQYNNLGKLGSLAIQGNVKKCEASNICEENNISTQITFEYSEGIIYARHYNRDIESLVSEISFDDEDVQKIRFYAPNNEENYEEYRFVYEDERVEGLETWSNHSTNGLELIGYVEYLYENENIIQISTLDSDKSVVDIAFFAYDEYQKSAKGSIADLANTGTFEQYFSVNNPILAEYYWNSEERSEDPSFSIIINYTYDESNYPLTASYSYGGTSVGGISSIADTTYFQYHCQ